MRFNIYQGDRLLFEKKFFYTLEKAWNFCKYGWQMIHAIRLLSKTESNG